MERRADQGTNDPPRVRAPRPAGAGVAAANSGDAGPAPPVLLVERLATFLKACFIYPDNNQRVQVTAELTLEELRQMFARRPMVEVLVGSHDLVVCGTRLPLRSHAQTWLRDLFVKALVGGLEFTATVDHQALVAAARRLQRAQTGKERGLGPWAEPIDGVRACELVMAGGHVEGEPGDEIPDTLTGGRTARQRALEAKLTASPRVRERLEALRALLAADAGDQAPAVIDVVSELVQCLPAEANQDHAYAEVLAEKILAATEAQIGKGSTAPRDRLATTFLSVGKKVFTASVGKEVASTASGRGHGDEKVVESLDELLADLQKLEVAENDARAREDWTRDMQELKATDAADEAAPVRPFDPRDIGDDVATELIGIVLHATVHVGEVHEPTVRRQLVQALRAGRDRMRQLVNQYLNAALTGDDADQRPSWRLLRLLDHPEVVGALYEAKLLEPEAVAAQFPKTFGLFLDSLPAGDGNQRLARLCRLLDRPALEAAGAWLDRRAEVLSPARIDQMFAAMTPRALPLAIVALRHAKGDCKAATARYLRQAGATGAATVALRVVDPATRLPREYLEQLCRQLADETAPTADLVALSGSLTRGFVQGLSGDPEQEARRVFAIQALHEVPTIETRVLLNELIRARRHLFLPRESRAVRTAARATLSILARKAGANR
jgi:hypothetical protein